MSRKSEETAKKIEWAIANMESAARRGDVVGVENIYGWAERQRIAYKIENEFRALLREATERDSARG